MGGIDGAPQAPETLVIEERQLQTRDRQVIETVLYAVPNIDGDGQVVGTRAMYVDVTTRKKAQAALREREEEVRLLLDSAGPRGIYGLNLEGNCTFCNRARPLDVRLSGRARCAGPKHAQPDPITPALMAPPYPVATCKIYQAFSGRKRDTCDR